ncbi:hypothetical protein ACVFI8_10475 [Agarivorans sp. MS3-6]|uniref:hypothetical protein n=1 Tax=Agarivorans sp. TSD2052 TaxID=2937286 RepID=UPI00200F64B4|nr:hypothetical protein [Agarivorans sp. TSD2052]UPW18603.1 hypothetical protein M0C34_20700 [Agarivorans sp. TSD2052]
MDGFWRGLFFIIVVMLLVRCDTNSSLYDAEENGIRVEVPRFLQTPILWVDKQVGEQLLWGFNPPWADDYVFQLYKETEGNTPPAE